jgi:hypothetical protein
MESIKDKPAALAEYRAELKRLGFPDKRDYRTETITYRACTAAVDGMHHCTHYVPSKDAAICDHWDGTGECARDGV